MVTRQPGVWRHQDGQVIARKGPGKPHAQRRWDERAEVEADRPDLVGLPVRVAWAESERLDSGQSWCRRVHPSGMVIVSRWGCIQTAYYDEQQAEQQNRNSDIRFTEADS